eukprot:6414297-Prymnesium_polylepis.3
MSATERVLPDLVKTRLLDDSLVDFGAVAFVTVANAANACAKPALAHPAPVISDRDCHPPGRDAVECLEVNQELLGVRVASVVRDVAERRERLVVGLGVGIEEGGARAERGHVVEVVVRAHGTGAAADKPRRPLRRPFPSQLSSRGGARRRSDFPT